MTEEQNARYKVKINASIQQFPLSYIKKLNTKSTPSVVHICDVEGKSAEDIEKFHSVLSQLKEAKEQKHIEYGLGYSNLTFELWMILHKKDCNSPFSDRSQYLGPINSAYNEKFNSLKSYKGFKYYQDNPSLSIWKIVNDILNECIQ